MRASRSFGWPKCPFLSFTLSLFTFLCFSPFLSFSSLLSFLRVFSPLLQFDPSLTRSNGEGEFFPCITDTLSQFSHRERCLIFFIFRAVNSSSPNLDYLFCITSLLNWYVVKRIVPARGISRIHGLSPPLFRKTLVKINTHYFSLNQL